MSHSRREFLADVGKGMIAASLGAGLANELGLCPAIAGDEVPELTFGALEPLVDLIEDTPKNKLLPLLVEKLNSGTDLKQLTAAAAFANARTFGGENYFGFHTFMALSPAYHMAGELPTERAALPLLKVLYRNAHYTESVGGRKNEVLKPMTPAESATAEAVHKAVNAGDRVAAERLLAAVAKTPEDALDAALLGVADTHDVHTAVMPWRAYAMLDIVGREHAVTLLRQSVRQCAKQCESQKDRMAQLAAQRKILPGLLEKHKLPKNAAGIRTADDAWVEKLCATILASSQEQAGEAVAMALAEGFSSEDIGQAVSMAANQLVLRQVESWDGKNTIGRRTHGDSPGVHASDATNAWRNMSRVSNPRNRAAGLILAAMDVARSHTWKQPGGRAGFEKEPFPHAEHMEKVRSTDAAALLKELDGAIRENDQMRAAALAHTYGQRKHAPRPMFDLLLGYAVSEDGRLHAEKYYRTVTEEFATTRDAFKWRQLVALARVTASMYSYSQQDVKGAGRAPGYEEACKLLRV
jgi:hypothetical protein